MTDSRQRLLRRIAESFGFKIIKIEQSKHFRLYTECGRCFAASISPSDVHWENNFRRQMRNAARERDMAGLLPADVARCTGSLNRHLEIMSQCQDCRRRTDDPHDKQTYMLPPRTIELGCEYYIRPVNDMATMGRKPAPLLDTRSSPSSAQH